MEKRLEVDIQVIVHATEDPQKIFDAFKDVFDLDVEDFVSQDLRGHFDNPITLLQAKLKKKKSRQFVKTLVSGISQSDVEMILEDIESRCDDSSLFLRISKQGLVQKRIVLGDEDPVKLRIYTPVYSQKNLSKTYSEILRGTI
ncbi:RNA-binding domain-containing protein [Candidatus Nitrosotenuis uzonensis]|uniref:Exosome protein n=1 Tax=Candidatus Nitrosotenuis uzonensis TaxID=1407055 RepID=V6AUR7_9ARCH|nr:RNA-binding domain-containing protein [Candidatus Nitrosotenuis uzonensis]CDI06198.1 conserved hypothetical protein [Candidatus Nitrosotenuis uzonensis]